jgi:hypothetical protein
MSLARYYLALLASQSVRPWKVAGDYYYNCGGPNYTDPEGTLWRQFYSQSGNNLNYGAAYSQNPLWVNIIYGEGPFTVPLPPGRYELTAYIKEVYVDASGRRGSGLALVDGPEVYYSIDGFIGERGTPEADRIPAVFTYSVPVEVGANGLALHLVTSGDVPIISALSFKIIP